MAEEPKVKSGWKTSEFLGAAVVSVVGLLIAAGLIHLPETGTWGPAIGAIMATFTQGLYALSRAAVKNAAAMASQQGGAILGELLKKKLESKPPVEPGT